jgi:integrase
VAAHLVRRDSIFYLIDGKIRKSLKTDKKGLAQHRLKQYIRGKYGFEPTPTVEDFYERWIEDKVEPLVRRSLIRDYQQHFKAYILPALKHVRLAALSTRDLNDLRVSLLKRGLSLKSTNNIIGASFRAMYRDARLEIEALQGKDPFIDLKWPRMPAEKPDPFTAEERDRIIEWHIKNDFFYYPLVAWQFHTGMRPSETFALTWRDVNLEGKTVSINRSRSLGVTAATKTAHADRIIPLSDALVSILKLLPSRKLGIEHVFVGKFGDPMSKKWGQHYWTKRLKKLDIRHRKFYATRHTFITEQVKAGKNLKAIADYVGTSVAMIEKNYCARQGLSINQPNFDTVDILNSGKDSFGDRDSPHAPRCENDPR